jgi:hypothetical protein
MPGPASEEVTDAPTSRGPVESRASRHWRRRRYPAGRKSNSPSVRQHGRRPPGARPGPWVWAAALACLTGCFLSKLLPDTRTAAERAREVAGRCSAFSEETVRPLASPSVVEAVEPAYAYVSSGPADREPRLHGARIHLRPVAGLSRETIQRSLECHQAHVVLGTAPMRDEDPYVLPGAWLDIDASSEGDGFMVAVQANTIDDAKRVLRRARLFETRNR